MFISCMTSSKKVFFCTFYIAIFLIYWNICKIYILIEKNLINVCVGMHSVLLFVHLYVLFTERVYVLSISTEGVYVRLRAMLVTLDYT